ncbi:class I SAM-dependent methyltransferase [Streptomyces sp. NPDC004111]|uniref:class I SAM-dependent methyltransferase n=1 Tax=Streptomyces sp. NPDC004111 TaxID=3364690 RepID=UPI0036C158A5
MPTLPREQPEQPPVEAHLARRIAESFGSDAARYDRARPGYPEELVARIVSTSPTRIMSATSTAGPGRTPSPGSIEDSGRSGRPLGPGSGVLDVLDVGCGTGIAGRQFLAVGCSVLGVEPDARMAARARATGLRVEVATFEDWEPAGRTFGAVVAAQSWHWVDPVAGAAKAAQVLLPGGRLAVFGHVYEPPAEVAEAFAAAYRRAVPDSPFHGQPARRPLSVYRAMYAKVADGIRESGRFGEPEQWRFDRVRTYTRDQWLDLLPTTGPLTGLGPGPLAEVLGPVGDAVDALGGSFTMSFTTLATTAVRTGGSLDGGGGAAVRSPSPPGSTGSPGTAPTRPAGPGAGPGAPR